MFLMTGKDSFACHHKPVETTVLLAMKFHTSYIISGKQ